MARPRKYPEELRERAVRFYFESDLPVAHFARDLGAAPSVGSKGNAHDNAMAEAWVATLKSELVDGRRFPSFEHAEHEVLHWISFYNGERLHEALGDLPPVEYEELKYQERQQPNGGRHLTEPPTGPGWITRYRA